MFIFYYENFLLLIICLGFIKYVFYLNLMFNYQFILLLIFFDIQIFVEENICVLICFLVVFNIIFFIQKVLNNSMENSQELDEVKEKVNDKYWNIVGLLSVL